MTANALQQRYTAVAILLHWAIAAFVVFNLCFGFGGSILSAHQRSPRSGVTIGGWFRLPPIMPLTRIPVPRQKEVHDLFDTINSIGGCIMLALVTGHVAAALRHQWLDRMPELARMGIGRLRR